MLHLHKFISFKESTKMLIQFVVIENICLLILISGSLIIACINWSSKFVFKFNTLKFNLYYYENFLILISLIRIIAHLSNVV